MTRPDWSRAACAGMDTEAFAVEHSDKLSRENQAARRVCFACEIRADCDRWALERTVEWGRWRGIIVGGRVWDSDGRPRLLPGELPDEASAGQHLSTIQAAERLGVSRDHIGDAIRRGDLPAVQGRATNGRIRYLVSVADLEAYRVWRDTAAARQVAA